MEYLSNSEEETQDIATIIAGRFKSGVITLNGELGAGKTTFTQGFAKALGIKDKITSPTFVLIRQYQIPESKKTLYHIDLYRLDNIIDLKSLGLNEIISNPDNIVLIEWAEKIEKSLPEKTVKISLQKITENERLITLS